MHTYMHESLIVMCLYMLVSWIYPLAEEQEILSKVDDTTFNGKWTVS